mmetsp:Transcript_5729/g.20857  ORF Transcript_5729/g.20857 Transcript_5729/m.20857 type:complete len:112 (-) Transcript_5729:754-1089(-)
MTATESKRFGVQHQQVQKAERVYSPHSLVQNGSATSCVGFGVKACVAASWMHMAKNKYHRVALLLSPLLPQDAKHRIPAPELRRREQLEVIARSSGCGRGGCDFSHGLARQ